MAWSTPNVSEVLSELSPREHAALQAAQGVSDSSVLQAFLARTVAEFRDAIRTGGYALSTDATQLPLGLHTHAIAITRWRYLLSIPKLDSLQTADRKAAADRAETLLDKIASQKYQPEPPTTAAQPAGGSWNGENKLLTRTHPTPRPDTQFQGDGSQWANQAYVDQMVATLLQQETTARQAADADLADSIQNETTAREEAIAALQNALTQAIATAVADLLSNLILTDTVAPHTRFKVQIANRTLQIVQQP